MKEKSNKILVPIVAKHFLASLNTNNKVEESWKKELFEILGKLRHTILFMKVSAIKEAVHKLSNLTCGDVDTDNYRYGWTDKWSNQDFDNFLQRIEDTFEKEHYGVILVLLNNINDLLETQMYLEENKEVADKGNFTMKPIYGLSYLKSGTMANPLG